MTKKPREGKTPPRKIIFYDENHHRMISSRGSTLGYFGHSNFILGDAYGRRYTCAYSMTIFSVRKVSDKSFFENINKKQLIFLAKSFSRISFSNTGKLLGIEMVRFPSNKGIVNIELGPSSMTTSRARREGGTAAYGEAMCPYCIEK